MLLLLLALCLFCVRRLADQGIIAVDGPLERAKRRKRLDGVVSADVESPETRASDLEHFSKVDEARLEPHEEVHSVRRHLAEVDVDAIRLAEEEWPEVQAEAGVGESEASAKTSVRHCVAASERREGETRLNLDAIHNEARLDVDEDRLVPEPRRLVFAAVASVEAGRPMASSRTRKSWTASAKLDEAQGYTGAKT